MKKVLVLMAVLLCLSSFASCGKSEGGSTTSTTEFNAETATYFEWIKNVAPFELVIMSDFKIMADGSFYFSSDESEDGVDIDCGYLVEGNNVMVEYTTRLLEKNIRMIYGGEYDYTILTDEKKYTKTEKEDDDDGSFLFDFEEIEYVGSEYKEFDGKTEKVYIFEEKKTAESGEKNDAERFSIRVCEGRIVAFETDDGRINIKELSEKAPEGAFEIPDDHTEISFDEFYALLYSSFYGTDDTDPDVTEPDVTEPDVTEPDVTEPEATEPDVTEPVTTAAENDVSPFELLKNAAPEELMQIEGFRAFVNERFYLKYADKSMGDVALLFKDSKMSYLMNYVFENGTIRIIAADDTYYYLFDDAKKYYSTSGSTMNTGLFNNTVSAEYSGVEEIEFDGKTVKAYYFSTTNIDGDTTKLGFYVYDGEITGLESDGVADTILALSAEPPAGAFEVPLDYEEITYEEFVDLANKMGAGE